MAIQRLISGTDRERLRQTSQFIGASFVWEDTPDGHDYWSSVAEKLQLISEHGTNDGEPWVEPEPEGPKWRVATDADALRRAACRFRDREEEEWEEGTLIFTRTDQGCKYPFLVVVDFPSTKSFVTNPYRFCEVEDVPAEEEDDDDDNWRVATAEDVDGEALFFDDRKDGYYEGTLANVLEAWDVSEDGSEKLGVSLYVDDYGGVWKHCEVRIAEKMAAEPASSTPESEVWEAEQRRKDKFARLNEGETKAQWRDPEIKDVRRHSLAVFSDDGKNWSEESRLVAIDGQNPQSFRSLEGDYWRFCQVKD